MDGQHYDEQTYAGDHADQVGRTQRNMPQEDRSSRSEVEAHVATDQSAKLAPHVRMGDDRAIGSPPNWESLTSTQLHAAATQRNSPNTADNLGRAFNEGGNRLVDAANRLLSAVGKLDAAWTGQAADAARGALTPLAQSAGQAGQAAQLMGAQMARQTAAASDVRKLPPPKEFDYQAELQQALANPNPVAGLADMKAKKDEADAVKREQVSYLNAYTQTMSAVDSQTPSFIEPAGNISGGDDGKSHITGGTIDYRGPAGGVPPRQGTSTGAPSGPAVIGVPAGGGSPGFGPDGEDQDVAPLPGFGPSGAGTGTSGYAPTPTTAPTLPGGPGGPHAGGPGAGSGGFGNAFGSFGGGPAAGGAPGSGSGGAPGRGAGPGGAAGAGEPAGGRAAGGAGTGAGRGGAAGAGGMGAGRGGRKEDDEEHERPSYLVEGDPEGTFGSDELTAPPVIGQE